MIWVFVAIGAAFTLGALVTYVALAWVNSDHKVRNE